MRSLIIRDTKLNSAICDFSKAFCDISKVLSFIVAFESNRQKGLEYMVEFAGQDGDKTASEREWSLDLRNYGTEADCRPLAANSNETWNSIGNLSETVLNRLRKMAPEGGGITSGASYARTGLGGGRTASDWDKGGGVGTGVKVFGRTLDAAIQHSPDTDEESSREDRAISHSVDW